MGNGDFFDSQGIQGKRMRLILNTTEPPEKRDPGCLGDLLGIILLCYVRIIKKIIVRIPIKQPSITLIWTHSVACQHEVAGWMFVVSASRFFLSTPTHRRKIPMQIFVKTLTGQTITLDVEATTKIGDQKGVGPGQTFFGGSVGLVSLA